MRRYQVLIVSLDPNVDNSDLIRAADQIARAAGSRRVVFMCRWGIPQAVAQMVPPGHAPVETAELMSRLERQVAGLFSAPAQTELRKEPEHSGGLNSLLELAAAEDADLVIGPAHTPDHPSDIGQSLVQRANCSVLLVPPGGGRTFRRIVAGVDFSEHSADALETAAAIARGVNASLCCVHVYCVPAGYHAAGHTYEQFARLTEYHARRELEQMLLRIDLHGVDVRTTLVLDDRPAAAIVRTAATEEADLVVVGTRGRTRLAALLLGSTTEKILRKTTRPVLAVRRKGERLTLLKAIMEV